MSSITQGKTNWKFLLIVFVLALIAAGGTLVYQSRLLSDKMVDTSNITKDCANKGERVRASGQGFPEICCSNLKPMYGPDREDCSSPYFGDIGTCSDCGNGICESQNNENKCNCSRDCSGGETAGWKTLKSRYLGFEIKYPNNWSYSEDGGGPNLYSPTEFTEEPQSIKWRAVLFFDRTGVQSFDEYIADRFGPTDNNKIISDSTVSLYGLSGREIVYTCNDCKVQYIPEYDIYKPGNEGRVILISKNSDTFIVWFYYYKNDPKATDYLKTFDQMLSTFKFLE